MSRLDSIVSYIDEANTFADLISIIPHIPLAGLQSFVKRNIQESSNKKINTIYHESLPIDHVLPQELIQNILSFNALSIAQRAVNKTFKRLCDTNEAIALKQRNEIIQDPKYEFQIGFQSGTRWIVHQDKKYKLNDEEIARGYKGPLQLENTLKQCQSEDVLLLHDGEYGIDANLFFNDKDLSFIGIGNNVTVRFKNRAVSVTHKTYLKNLSLETDSDHWFALGKESHLWMEQCVVSAAAHFDMESELCDPMSLHLKKCIFDGKECINEANTIDISVTKHSEVEIVGCTFTKWGDSECPVILLYDAEDEDYIEHLGECSKESIKIVGNIFSNNDGVSVAFTDDNGPSQERKEHYNALMQSNIVSIHHNISQNKNGRIKEETSLHEKPNPNQISIL